MLNTSEKERSFAGIYQLSFRSLLIGAVGSCIITASSMYTALRMSALPWPTIFVAVLSMALLKILGKTTFNEINITKTAMSAGAMIAGGLAFTLPGLWITGVWSGPDMFRQHFWKVLAIAMAGMLLGTVLTWLLRPRFVEVEALPYPIGAAAAETIKAGDAGGKKSAVLFGTMVFSTVFTFFRDSLRWIPDVIVSNWLYARNFFIGLWVSPLAIGTGYLIGTLYTGVWFLGAVLSYLLIIPLGITLKLFPSVEDAVSFKGTIGIGLMVGTGAGILISYIIANIKPVLARSKSSKPTINTQGNNKNSKNASSVNNTSRTLTVISVAIAFILSIACGLRIIPSILLIAGVFLTSAMAATITGQTGIDPMEIFGIIILLAIRIFVDVDATGAFFIAACVAVSCGYAGDLLNDYKAGYILGSNPVAQLISQTVGGIVGTVVAAASMFAIINQFGGVGVEKGLPAAQAFAVSQMVNGIGNPLVFWIAITIGVVLYLLKVPVMTLGIGMYLPFEISSVVLLGGLIRFIADRRRPCSNETGNIAASGLLGGEGITGVAIAIIRMVTGR
ncbi:MAG: OPT/YSL family transporter [Firmicutes bacterium]|nr:OPT/YSL family transporter [Bacillota bacterium]